MRSLTWNAPGVKPVVSPIHLKPSQSAQSPASDDDEQADRAEAGAPGLREAPKGVPPPRRPSCGVPTTPFPTALESLSCRSTRPAPSPSCKELRELTGDENGAQRVAWTQDLGAARRSGCASKLEGTGAEMRDRRRPATSGGRCAAHSEHALLIGGHIDSVPNGGWLDGCLNVVAGVEVLRRIAAGGRRRR